MKNSLDDKKKSLDGIIIIGYKMIANVLPFIQHDCEKMSLINEFVFLAENLTIGNVFKNVDWLKNHFKKILIIPLNNF